MSATTRSRSTDHRRRASVLGYRATAQERRWLTRGALLYTTCDEDSDSELTGLALKPDDDVVSITGSGCRSLSLLVAGPRSVVSVDANPLQNHLLALKAAGIAAYEREEFLELIGAREVPPSLRRERYRAIADRLDPEVRSFWDGNEHVIARGVLFSGAHETFYRYFIAPLIKGLRRRRLRELYAFSDVEQQARFYEQHWNHLGWRTAVKLLAQPWSVRLLLGDPSYYAHVTRPEGFAAYLTERLRHVFSQHLARDNDVFTMYVHGRYLHDEAMPVYLRPGAYEQVRRRIDRLSIVTAPIDEYLAALPAASVSAFSLSDITGWLPADAFAAVLADAVRAGRSGARLVYRCFLTDRPLPEDLRGVRSRDDVAAALTDRDRAFAFTFVVAEVEGDR